MYLRLDQIKGIPFKHVGKDVRISDKCSIYNPENISIGDNTRIDDFTILSAGVNEIRIGSYVHIACYTSLIGAGLIDINDFVELSGRVSVYSSTNDYRQSMYWDEELNRVNVIHDEVRIGRHVVIGAGSVILPGVIIEHYARVGALSLVKSPVGYKEMWAGVPAKKIGSL